MILNNDILLLNEFSQCEIDFLCPLLTIRALTSFDAGESIFLHPNDLPIARKLEEKKFILINKFFSHERNGNQQIAVRRYSFCKNFNMSIENQQILSEIRIYTALVR